MGQKIHPRVFGSATSTTGSPNWFEEKNFADRLQEDLQIRDHIEKKLSHAGLSSITIERRGEVSVDIHTARPGIVIGKSGSEVDALRKELHKLTGSPVKVNIREVKRPELDAKLVAQSIAEQLQNRVAFRRAMKRALTSAMRSGAKGVKVQVSGRLGGAEMARTSYSDGRVPLHTLRANIDYGFFEARTTTGRIGVKCWINKGEVMPGSVPISSAPMRRLRWPGGGREGGRDRGGRGDRDRGGRGPGGGGRGPGGGGRGRVGPAAVVDPVAAVSVRAVPAADVAPVAVAAAVVRTRWRRRSRSGWRRRWWRSWTRWSRRRTWPRWRKSWTRWRWSLMLMPKRVKHRKQMRGRMRGNTKGGSTVAFGEYGLKTIDPRLAHQPSDPGRSYRDDPQDQTWREGLDQRLPRQAVHEEASRDPNGLRQGNPEGWVAVVKPGKGRIRARRRPKGDWRAKRCASPGTSFP